MLRLLLNKIKIVVLVVDMSQKTLSAGLLMFRQTSQFAEFYIVHPGGPFWTKKDAGAWSIPKGLVDGEEAPLLAAEREFFEETGFSAEGSFIELGEVTLKSGKRIVAWAFEKDIGDAKLVSNSFTMEWPPKSGKMTEFPEVDRGGYFSEVEAREKLNPAQAEFVDRLLSEL